MDLDFVGGLEFRFLRLQLDLPECDLVFEFAIARLQPGAGSC